MRSFFALLASAASLSLSVLGPAQSPIGTAVAWSTAVGGNGNYYQAVSAPGGITWSAAQAWCLLNKGHLATITSAAENAFVFAVATGPYTAGLWQTILPGGTYGPWLGGTKSGSWGWVTGEPFGYSNWDPGEPNNGCTGQTENKLHFGAGTPVPSPTWNDFPDAGCALITTPNGFIVEYPNLIYDAGPIVTSVTGGVGGTQLSELQNTAPTSLSIFGFGAQNAGPNTLVDDFTVCGTWTITHIEVFSYVTGNPTAPSPVTGVYADFYAASPATGALPMAGSPGMLTTFPSNQWSGIYRAATTAPGTTRAIIRSTAALPVPLTLGPGVYWFAFRVAGGNFVPPITVLNQRVTGNALQQAGVGAPWLPITSDATGFSPAPQGLPFRFYGTSTGGGPGTIVNTMIAPCSAAGITVRGAPVLGGFIRTELTGITGFGFIGYGFMAFAVPFCSCVIGHEWAVANFAAADVVMIPPGPALCGVSFRIQGLDFFSTGGCPSPPLALTETYQVNLQ